MITDGKADERYGVCSNYLERLEKNEEIQLFVRSAPGFHLPKDTTHPIILIGPGNWPCSCLLAFEKKKTFKLNFHIDDF